jgi:hypothetical protein
MDYTACNTAKANHIDQITYRDSELDLNDKC